MRTEPATAGAPSLGDRAYAVLRARIIGLAYAPGDRLVERDLAAELAISRIPLREALRRLQNDGLVVTVPRRGAVVSPFTADDVRHLFDVRESLEVLAFRLAAAHGDSADGTGEIDRTGVARLRANLVAAREATARGDAAAIAAVNAGFHRIVVDLAANPLLTSLMDPLGARLEWLFRLTAERDPVVQCQEHEDLCEALAAHDVEQVERLAFAHVRSGRDVSIALAATWSPGTLDLDAATRARRR